ncbi:hypothetical protein [Kitasatospora sp. NPDC001175]|uniref:hypothetical protein n=1 Tax=Kitasatospora sp. NPDC001175 TaxID=3157103 RepID=UPI003D089C9D
MDTEELVRSWKDPRVRQNRAAGHPAGEIKLGGGGALGRRSGLLAGAISTAGDLWAEADNTIITSCTVPE